MSVLFSQTPAYATVRAKARVAFGLTGGGNFVRVWCVGAPDGASRKQQLDRGQSRIEEFAGDRASTWEFAPDVGGVYRFVAQEYTKGVTPGFTGGYKGDPRGFQAEAKIGGETALSIDVGDRLTQKLGVGQDTATLVLHTFGADVRPTTFDIHGEVSPALTEIGSPKAKTAAADATVAAAMAALVTGGGQPATTILNLLANVADNIIQKFNAHRIIAGVHAANDTDNVISRAFETPTTPAGLVRSVGEILRVLGKHMRNEGPGGVTGGAGYHVVGVINRADWTNITIAQPPSDLTGCIVGLADIWRAYEAHRGSLTVHPTADSANILNALPPLLELHRAFLSSLQATSPTVPNTSNPATIVLVHGAGFKIT